MLYNKMYRLKNNEKTKSYHDRLNFYYENVERVNNFLLSCAWGLVNPLIKEDSEIERPHSRLAIYNTTESFAINKHLLLSLGLEFSSRFKFVQTIKDKETGKYIEWYVPKKNTKLYKDFVKLKGTYKEVDIDGFAFPRLIYFVDIPVTKYMTNVIDKVTYITYSEKEVQMLGEFDPEIFEEVTPTEYAKLLEDLYSRSNK